jgi:hypothetical protein
METLAALQMYVDMQNRSVQSNLGQALKDLIEEAQHALRCVERGDAPTKISAMTNLMSEVTRHTSTMEMTRAVASLLPKPVEAPPAPPAS